MKKLAVGIAIGGLLTSGMLLSVAHADTSTANVGNSTINSISSNTRLGLLGYYFHDENFDKLSLFAPSENKNLCYNQDNVNKLLKEDHQEYQSIRWIGYINSSETGDFYFKLTNDDYSIIEVNNQIVSNQGKQKIRVHLEKNKLIPIHIEYKMNSRVNQSEKNLKDLKLFKINNVGQEKVIESNELRQPDFNSITAQNWISNVTKRNMFTNNVTSILTDTDGDGIPDEWEEQGYTIQNKIAVKWNKDLESKGYTKFLSDPLESHTAGDPFTDYEKASRDIDSAHAKESYNPMIATFPVINTSLDYLNFTRPDEESQTKEITTENIWALSTIVSKGEQYQTPDSVAIMPRENYPLKGDGYLNANARYNNIGTGTVYDAKPNTRLTLAHHTLGTIKQQSHGNGFNIISEESYPKKNIPGLPLSELLNEGSLHLKQEISQIFSQKYPLMTHTDPVEGDYKIKDAYGNLVTGGRWNDHIPHIKGQTASLIVVDENNKRVKETRVAAKYLNDPEDKTPSLTLEEAIKIAFPKMGYEWKVKDVFTDAYTKKEMQKQGNPPETEVKLSPKMNFTLVVDMRDEN